MIDIYKASNTNYARNGDVTVQPVSCIFYGNMTTQEYRIELTCRYDAQGRWKYLEKENVICCPTPWSKKQLFRIYDLDKEGRTITAYARHIFFDLIHAPILDRRAVNQNGEDALNILLEGTGFRGHSDVLLIESAYWIRKNIVQAISGDDENSILNRWGGELLPDNFDVYVLSRIGSDNGVSARFGYNIKSIKETSSVDNVVTRIIPIGYDGIMLDGDEPWVDSPNIGIYAMVRANFIEYSEIRVKDADGTEGYETLEEAQAALKAAAEADFEAGIDEPSVNYVVDMVQLANTTAYQNYQMLENINLGDTIHCRHKDIDIDVSARCISIEWDCIRKKARKVEIGNYIASFLEDFRTTESQASSASAAIQKMYTKEETNEMLQSYMKAFAEGYVTGNDLNTKLEDYVTGESLGEQLKKYVLATSLETTLASYVTGNDLNTKLEDYVTGESLRALEERVRTLEESAGAEI